MIGPAGAGDSPPRPRRSHRRTPWKPHRSPSSSRELRALAGRRSPVVSDNILWVLLGAALLYYFAQDPKQTLEDVKTGLSNGTIWALIALGYTLVYGIIELINFAHGEVFMIGSFVSVSIWATLGVDGGDRRRCATILAILAGLVVAMVASGTLNVMIERVAYKPLRNAPKLAPLITAIGMSFILQNVGLLWRPTPDSVPDLIRSQKEVFTIFDVAVLRSDVFAVDRDGPAARRAAVVRRRRRSTARRCGRPRRTPTRRGSWASTSTGRSR